MGRIKCKKHGLQPFREICQHLAKDFSNGIYPEFKQSTLTYILLCLECHSQYNWAEFDIDFKELEKLPEHEVKEMEQQFDKSYESINRSAWCVQCINEVELAHNRRLNKLDPFEAFENTMLFENWEEIDQLGKLLRSQFSFGKSNNPLFDTDNLYLIPGTIKTPLLIKISEEVDATKQMEILTVIDSFFEGRELFQRRILFIDQKWEEENGSIALGKGRIIKEIVVK